MIPALTLLATFVLLGLPAAIVLFPLAMLTRNVLPLYRSAMTIVRLGLRLARIRVEATGLENIPADRAVVFMANHVSNLDPPVLLPLIPGRTSIFLKQSLMRIPILGWGMRLGEFIPVARDGSPASAQQNVRTAASLLARGIHLTIFVEGTRSRDGRLLPFKKGPFFLAQESGALCIPVTLHGTASMMRKGSLRVYPATARVTFHPALDPARFDSRDDLMAAVRAAIASALPPELRA